MVSAMRNQRTAHGHVLSSEKRDAKRDDASFCFFTLEDFASSNNSPIFLSTAAFELNLETGEGKKVQAERTFAQL
jgi:hypothetical protein